MTPEEALRRSNAAERIFKDPLVQETLDFMEKEISDMWAQTPVRDVEARESLWRLAVSTRKFRDLLRGTMEAGKLAKDAIVRKESTVQRLKSTFNNWR